jgi:hypothetical protein
MEKLPNYNVHIVNFGKPIDELVCDEIFNLNDINFTNWDDIKDNIKWSCLCGNENAMLFIENHWNEFKDNCIMFFSFIFL